MKDKTRNMMAAVMAVLFIGMTCWVSNADYNHTVVGTMDDDVYEMILHQLADSGNHSPSEAEIVEWWKKHHQE